MVLHTNGWHKVAIQYCECNQIARPGTRVQQLLRYELYPATTSDPTTCATFRALELYHTLTLQSKISVYDFYLSLNHITDNTGVDITWVCDRECHSHSFSSTPFFQDRIKQVLRMVREWRHLKSLKRAGRAHEPGGPDGTSHGELAIRCPACPRPGVNLPENWRDVPDDMKCVTASIFVSVSLIGTQVFVHPDYRC